MGAITLSSLVYQSDVIFQFLPSQVWMRPARLMIGAGHLDRLQHALEAELLDAVGGDVEVLEAPPHLLAGQRLVAELLLRGADRLDAELSR